MAYLDDVIKYNLWDIVWQSTPASVHVVQVASNVHMYKPYVKPAPTIHCLQKYSFGTL